jgi:hypothetical protein
MIDAGQVDGDHPVPAAAIDIREAAEVQHPCDITKNVDAAMQSDGLVDYVATRGFVRYVQRKGGGGRPDRLRYVSHSRCIAIADDDRRTLSRQAVGDGSANPRRCTRYYGDFAVQTHRRSPLLILDVNHRLCYMTTHSNNMWRKNTINANRISSMIRMLEGGCRMLPLQEISDRLEIQDLLSRYSYAIDDRDWDRLDAIFTPDAVIDYSETGGAKGNVAQIKAWLPVAMERFPR